MSNAPTFGSKFVEGDILLNLFDSSFYTCQKTGTFTQNWNKIGILGSTGGGDGGNIFNISGKAINNAGGVNYILENNASILIDKAGIPALFTGTAVSECTSAGCGLNKWFWKGLPSFQ